MDLKRLVVQRYDVVGVSSPHVRDNRCQELLKAVAQGRVQVEGDQRVLLETFLTHGCDPTLTAKVLALKTEQVLKVLYEEILPLTSPKVVKLNSSKRRLSAQYIRTKRNLQILSYLDEIGLEEAVQHLNDEQREVLEFYLNHKMCIKETAHHFKTSYTSMWYMIHGREGILRRLARLANYKQRQASQVSQASGQENHESNKPKRTRVSKHFVTKLSGEQRNQLIIELLKQVDLDKLIDEGYFTSQQVSYLREFTDPNRANYDYRQIKGNPSWIYQVFFGRPSPSSYKSIYDRLVNYIQANSQVG